MIKYHKTYPLLSGNALKLIAALSMLLDHIGATLLPEISVFRILGRLAFPIYAFMIAEGCQKTKNRRRYFLSVFALGVACQIVYDLYSSQIYLGILLTFSLSILLIYALQAVKKILFCGLSSRSRQILAILAYLLLLLGVYFLSQFLTIDYGFWGCMPAVFASVFRAPEQGASGRFAKLDRLSVHVGMLSLGLVILSYAQGGVQPYSLCAIPLLLCYSGARGVWNLKSFFYLFYPAHLAALELIAILIA